MAKTLEDERVEVNVELEAAVASGGGVVMGRNV